MNRGDRVYVQHGSSIYTGTIDTVEGSKIRVRVTVTRNLISYTWFPASAVAALDTESSTP
jgi:hypothetical protein